MTWLDPHGQPDPQFNAMRRAERDVCELLGLVKGVLADGVVSEEEADALYRWLAAFPDAVAMWPGDVIARRVRKIFADGVVTREEREDLAELLGELAGAKLGIVNGLQEAPGLPLDQPPPEVEIPGRVFVLTGRFAFGPRKVCEDAVRDLGGWTEPNVTLATNYVVVGTFCSRDWIHTSFGRKIEKAVNYREKHGWPRIIGEDHLAAQL